MIIVMKPGAKESSIKEVISKVKATGLDVHISEGKEVTIIGVVGNKNLLNADNITFMKDVDRILPVTESYKLANKKFHPEPSSIKIGNTIFFSKD